MEELGVDYVFINFVPVMVYVFEGYLYRAMPHLHD